MNSKSRRRQERERVAAIAFTLYFSRLSDSPADPLRTTFMRLALFDLDNTLLAGDSDFEWAQFLIEKGVLDREVHEARNTRF